MTGENMTSKVSKAQSFLEVHIYIYIYDAKVFKNARFGACMILNVSDMQTAFEKI